MSENIMQAQIKQLEKHLGTTLVNYIEPMEPSPMQRPLTPHTPTGEPPISPWVIPPTVSYQINQLPTTQHGNAWGYPSQAQQIVIVPVAIPMVRQLQPPVAQSNELQLRNFVQQIPEGNNQNSYQPQQNRFYQYLPTQLSNIMNENRGNDLRQILIRKRSQTAANRDPEPESYSYNPIDDELDNYIIQAQDDMENLDAATLDLTPLKLMGLSTSPQAKRWFIVVDIDIILNDNRFFNNLIGAGQNCFIVIPLHVIQKLEAMVAENTSQNIGRIWRFLSQQIESRLVLKGLDVYNDVFSIPERTFGTCLDAASETTCVILLSNNPATQMYKNNNHDIIIMTSFECKNILFNTPVNPVRARFPMMNLEITIPNNLHTNETETTADDYQIFSTTSRIPLAGNIKVENTSN